MSILQEALLSYARLEIAAMEKGLYLLEAIIAGAPLIDFEQRLRLVQVFSVLPSTGLSGGTEIFSEGIALALLTTLLDWNRYTFSFRACFPCQGY